MHDELDAALRERIAVYVVGKVSRSSPLTLEQGDCLRSALSECLFAPDGLGSAVREICIASNPDWKEKREQPEWVTLDEIHDIAVRAYWGEE